MIDDASPFARPSWSTAQTPPYRLPSRHHYIKLSRAIGMMVLYLLILMLQRDPTESYKVFESLGSVIPPGSAESPTTFFSKEDVFAWLQGKSEPDARQGSLRACAGRGCPTAQLPTCVPALPTCLPAECHGLSVLSVETDHLSNQPGNPRKFLDMYRQGLSSPHGTTPSAVTASALFRWSSKRLVRYPGCGAGLSHLLRPALLRAVCACTAANNTESQLR